MHDEYEISLHHYVNGRLTGVERRQFEQHLDTCNMCRSALADWEHIAEAMHDLAQEQANSLPPLNLKKRRNPMSYAIQPRYAVQQVVFGLVAALVLLVSGLFLMQISSNQSPTAVVIPAQQTDTVEIVLATRHLAPGQTIQAEDVTRFDLPIDVIPFTALPSVEGVVGQVATVPIVCGQPILSGQITERSSRLGYIPVEANVFETLHPCEGVSFDPLPGDFESVMIPIAVQRIQPLTVVETVMVSERPYPAQLVPEHVRLDLDRDFVGEMVLLDTPVESLLTTFALLDTWFDEGQLIEIRRDRIANDMDLMQFGDRVVLGSLHTVVDVEGIALEEAHNFDPNSYRSKMMFNILSSDVLLLSPPPFEDDVMVLGVSGEIEPELTNNLVNADHVPILLFHSVALPHELTD